MRRFKKKITILYLCTMSLLLKKFKESYDKIFSIHVTKRKSLRTSDTNITQYKHERIHAFHTYKSLLIDILCPYHRCLKRKKQ